MFAAPQRYRPSSESELYPQLDQLALEEVGQVDISKLVNYGFCFSDYLARFLVQLKQ